MGNNCSSHLYPQGEKVLYCYDCNKLVGSEVIAITGHIDDNGDHKCDNGCGFEYGNPTDHTPDEPTTPLPKLLRCRNRSLRRLR